MLDPLTDYFNFTFFHKWINLPLVLVLKKKISIKDLFTPIKSLYVAEKLLQVSFGLISSLPRYLHRKLDQTSWVRFCVSAAFQGQTEALGALLPPGGISMRNAQNNQSHRRSDVEKGPSGWGGIIFLSYVDSTAVPGDMGPYSLLYYPHANAILQTWMQPLSAEVWRRALTSLTR